MLQRNMARYRSFARILTGTLISVFLTPTALAIPSYNELLQTDYDSGLKQNTSIAQLNNTTGDLTKYVDSKQENLLNIVNHKFDELTRNFSTVVGILDIILFNDIVRSIQSRQFSIASDPLPYIKNYKYLVGKVYNNQIANFDLLLQYGDSVSDFRFRINVYNALYNEMKANGHKDIGKLLQLSESLEKVISNLSNKENIAETRLLISTLWNENQDTAIQFISNAFLHDSLWSMAKQHAETIKSICTNCVDRIYCKVRENWSMVRDLTVAINSSCTRCIDNVYTEVIENVLNQMKATDILKLAKNNLKCLDECILIYQAIFNKLNENSNSYSDSIISLAEHMKGTMIKPNYKNIFPDLQTRHEQIKNRLPLSLKNAVFSSLICIKNPTYDEYFFASSNLATQSSFNESEYGRNRDQRSVFTGIAEYGPLDDKAKFERKVSALDDNKFVLINKKFNEYVFSSYTTLDTGRMTYTKKAFEYTVTNPLGYWRFQVKGDNVYIKNAFLNEFLFAGSAGPKGLKSRHSVFTFIPPGGPPTGSEWKIIDCSNSR